MAAQQTSSQTSDQRSGLTQSFTSSQWWHPSHPLATPLKKRCPAQPVSPCPTAQQCYPCPSSPTVRPPGQKAAPQCDTPTAALQRCLTSASWTKAGT